MSFDFDPNSFISQETQVASERRPPVPAQDYVATIKELKADMKQIERDLPEVYVRKDDFRVAVKDMQDDIREVKSDMKEGLRAINDTLGVIFKKLDRKEDKE